jgi:DNA-binding GntR family transcriptional regulator
MSITPLYLRIAADIREQIRSGKLRPGDRLPSTRELQQQYGAGTTAIRNAMLILRSEGLVEGHQGRGVYVASHT